MDSKVVFDIFKAELKLNKNDFETSPDLKDIDVRNTMQKTPSKSPNSKQNYKGLNLYK